MSTSTFPLPAPAASDPPDGPTQIGALAGATETYLRAMAFAGAALQPGVVGATDFMVVQRAAGANLSVDVATHTGTGAYVTVDSQLTFCVPFTGSATNLTLATAHASNPRVDRVVLTGAPQASATVSVVTGTASSGATLTNLTGAGSVPANSLLLADVLVPATATTTSNSQIRDRRAWARGAYCRTILSSGSLSTASGNYALIDATNVAPRIECSGAPVRFTLVIPVGNGTTANNYFSIAQDGTGIESGAAVGAAVGGKYLGRWRSDSGSVDTQVATLHQVWHTVPAAGSHVFAPMWARDAGTLSALQATGSPFIFVVEERVVQNTKNNSTTSG